MRIHSLRDLRTPTLLRTSLLIRGFSPLDWAARYTRAIVRIVLFDTICSSVVIMAQMSAGEVHITPRIQSPVPKETEIESELKTHTKPFKVDVNRLHESTYYGSRSQQL